MKDTELIKSKSSGIAYSCNNLVHCECHQEGICCCDAAFIMMVRKIFSQFWQFVGSVLLSLSSYLLTISALVCLL